MRNDKRLSNDKRNHFKTGHVVSPYETAILHFCTPLLSFTFQNSKTHSQISRNYFIHPSNLEIQRLQTRCDKRRSRITNISNFRRSTAMHSRWLTDKVFTRQVVSRPNALAAVVSRVQVHVVANPRSKKRRRKCDSFVRFGVWKNCGALSRVYTRVSHVFRLKSLVEESGAAAATEAAGKPKAISLLHSGTTVLWHRLTVFPFSFLFLVLFRLFFPPRRPLSPRASSSFVFHRAFGRENAG